MTVDEADWTLHDLPVNSGVVLPVDSGVVLEQPDTPRSITPRRSIRRLLVAARARRRTANAEYVRTLPDVGECLVATVIYPPRMVLRSCGPAQVFERLGIESAGPGNESGPEP